MAAVNDKNAHESAAQSSGFELRQGLKGMKVGLPNLSTLAQKGNEQLVEQFLTENVQVGEGTNAKAQSQLYIASFWGFADVVKSLLENGADVNAQNNGTLWTPLHAAAFQEHGKIVMLLLDRGAQPQLADGQGRSAKDFASASDKVWPHFAALNCDRTSKQELVGKGIIKKVVESSRTGSAGRSGSAGSATRLSAFTRPGSAYAFQTDPFDKTTGSHTETTAQQGDVLRDSAGTSGRTASKPTFSVWRS